MEAQHHKKKSHASPVKPVTPATPSGISPAKRGNKEQQKSKVDSGKRARRATTTTTVKDDDDDIASIASSVEFASASFSHNGPQKDDTGFLPEAIFKAIGYVSSRDDKAEEMFELKQKETVAFIRKHFIIPQDIETNWVKFGPQSGQTFTERLIKAMENNLLKLKPSASSSTATTTTTATRLPTKVMCWRCGAQDQHVSRRCPSLLL